MTTTASDTAPVSRAQEPRQHSRRTLSAWLILALCLPLVLMITIGPMIANTNHFHQTVSHGPVAQTHHHFDAIAQADTPEQGTHHVHLSDSLQLNALVAGNSHTHHHANRDLIDNNPLIDYAEVFPDGLLRPPKI